MNTHNQPIVISVGGSLIVPDHIDTVFLRQFKEVIEKEVETGKRFILITGGGKTCRRYQAAAKEVIDMSNAELDWLGIYSTRFNAELVRILFRDLAHEEGVYDPHKEITWTKPLLFSAGWEPGGSTDMDAVLFAKKYGAQTLINLTNADHVYDKDPKKFDDAKPLQEVSWSEYRDIIPKKWISGMNTPFDPTASKMAEDAGIEVAVINGEKPKELKNYLDGKPFQGTRIHP